MTVGSFKPGQVPWNAGTKKVTDLNEVRECKECHEKKIVTAFVTGTGGLYRYLCKNCRQKSRRTGKVSETRFKPGHDKGVRFTKGHIPWYKKKGIPAPRTGMVDEKNENRFGSYKYKQWKKSVLDRDENKCVKCDSTNRLAAHHIVPWEHDEKKRFELENGMTLCCSCHAKEEGLGILIRP